MKLSFLGAAGEVTGSQHLIETRALRLLLDCGLFQGPRAASRRKNETFHCDPVNLDALILSHAHIDHSGNVPGLVRAGFDGPVYCTEATADVAEIMLRDAAKIQQEDAAYLSRKLNPGHPPVEPLYDMDDVKKLRGLFRPLPYHKWHEIDEKCRIRFLDAGHILGSAITEIDLFDGGEWKRVVFTGDLGRRDMPLLRDPEPIERCDVLICESTYGNRVHSPVSDIKHELLRIFKEAVAVEGKVVIPAFSLGRTQRLVYFLNNLTNEGLLPNIPIFIDSPLSNRLTSVYRDHKDIMDEDVQKVLETDHDPFGFQGLTFVASRDESIALNKRKGPFAVIAASGMCESGRVVHHLKHAVGHVENAIVMIGYQAPHTLGRRISDREPKVRIYDRQIPLRAHVEKIDGLSAHADVTDFKWWYEQAASAGGIGKCFLVHGETDSANDLAKVVDEFCDESPVVPELYQSFEI